MSPAKVSLSGQSSSRAWSNSSTLSDPAISSVTCHSIHRQIQLAARMQTPTTQSPCTSPWISGHVNNANRAFRRVRRQYYAEGEGLIPLQQMTPTQTGTGVLTK